MLSLSIFFLLISGFAQGDCDPEMDSCVELQSGFREELEAISSNFAIRLNEQLEKRGCATQKIRDKIVFSKLPKRSQPMTILSEQEAEEVFKALKMQKHVPWGIGAGCERRTHEFARLLDQQNITSAKVFTYPLEKNKTLSVRGNLTDKPNIWNFHVANLVMVKTKSGIVPMVMDPFLMESPVSPEVWQAKIKQRSPEVKTKLEFSDNRQITPKRFGDIRVEDAFSGEVIVDNLKILEDLSYKEESIKDYLNQNTKSKKDLNEFEILEKLGQHI